jgi:hypothetical protein
MPVVLSTMIATTFVSAFVAFVLTGLYEGLLDENINFALFG